MTADKGAFADKLQALKDAYDAQLGERIDALESALGAIGAAGDGAGKIAAVRELLELAHKIAGSAGTIGHQNSARRRRIWKFFARASSRTAKAQAPRSTRNLGNWWPPAAPIRAPETDQKEPLGTPFRDRDPSEHGRGQ